ncbi:MAG: hypothetical protein JWL87_39 [Candidatus Adlerbacteria bacterium]|nr:hypothetical protein [Candidatus Adlerbacteria bacterium]
MRALVVNHTATSIEAVDWESKLVTTGCISVSTVSASGLVEVAEEFDLVLLLGLSSQAEEGFVLIDTIRKRCGTPAIVVISRHGIPAVQQEAKERGAHLFLGKFISREQFNALLKNLMQNRLS